MRSLLVLVALAGIAHADSTDFSPQVRAMFRVAACGGNDAIPDKFPQKTIDAHCSEMKAVYTSYKKAWADDVQAFVAKLRPADLTTTVVYPFGGGDLSSALAVFPDAKEITTVLLKYVSLAGGKEMTVKDALDKLQGELTEIASRTKR